MKCPTGREGFESKREAMAANNFWTYEAMADAGVVVMCCLQCGQWHNWESDRMVLVRKGTFRDWWWWWCMDCWYGNMFMSWCRTMESVETHCRMQHRDGR